MPYYNNYLAHYGVKGMKWGVRRQRKKAARARAKNAQRADRENWKSMSRSERKANRDKANSRYTKTDRSWDEQTLGKRAARNINRRMNKGQSHTRAHLAEATRQTVVGAVGGEVAGLGALAAIGLASNPQLRRQAATVINNAAKQPFINFANSRAAKNAAKRAADMSFKLGNEVVKLKPWQYKVS